MGQQHKQNDQTLYSPCLNPFGARSTGWKRKRQLDLLFHRLARHCLQNEGFTTASKEKEGLQSAAKEHTSRSRRESTYPYLSIACTFLMSSRPKPKPPRSGEVQKERCKTYNSCHSLVVTDPTTTQPVHSLSLGELTGTRVLCVLWS